jgi:hypothetical protein
MESFAPRARKHVGDAAAEDRSDDAEHDRPEECQVNVHHRFRNEPREEPDKNIPEQVKHTFSSFTGLQDVVEPSQGSAIDPTLDAKG